MKLSRATVLTIIGSIILFISLGIGLYIFGEPYLFPTSSDPQLQPNQVQITNVDEKSFSVTWTTTSSTQGSVKYGTTSDLSKEVKDDRDEGKANSGTYKIHHVTLTDLQPETTYFFAIQSGDPSQEFDNGGSPYQAATTKAATAKPAPDLITGKTQGANQSPLTDALVLINMAGANTRSTIVKEDGSWMLNLAETRSADGETYLKYDPSTMSLAIQLTDGSQSSRITTTTGNDSPVPTITLGQDYDFSQTANATQNSTSTDSSGKPVAEVFYQGAQTTDTETGELLGDEEFIDVYAQQLATSSAEVTFINPSKNAVTLYTVTPQFIGTGPKSRILTLRLSGISLTKPETAKVTVDSKGSWSYSFDEPLDEGSYVLEIDFINSKNLNETVKRTFYISSDELSDDTDYAAYEASGSADVEEEEVDVRPSIPSTESGVPVSGHGGPTALILIFGALLLLGGYFIKARNLT